MANVLVARGVKRGDRVAVQAKKSVAPSEIAVFTRAARVENAI